MANILEIRKLFIPLHSDWEPEWDERVGLRESHRLGLKSKLGLMGEWLNQRSAKPSTAVRIRFRPLNATWLGSVFFVCTGLWIGGRQSCCTTMVWCDGAFLHKCRFTIPPTHCSAVLAHWYKHKRIAHLGGRVAGIERVYCSTCGLRFIVSPRVRDKPSLRIRFRPLNATWFG